MVPTPAAVLETAEPDDLVVIVASEEALDCIDTDVAHWHARFGDDHEKRNQPEPTNVAQLRAERDSLEHELEREKAQLDAVITRYERILAERTRSSRKQPVEKQERDGLLARARRWMRDLLP